MTNQPSNNQFADGPYIQVAGMCEKVLREADGMLSVIRFVDSITHTESGANPPVKMPELKYPLTLVLALKAGNLTGTHEITLIAENPERKTLPPIKRIAEIVGDIRAITMVINVRVTYTLEGQYFFNVMFDGKPLTKIPLLIIYNRDITQPEANPQVKPQ